MQKAGSENRPKSVPNPRITDSRCQLRGGWSFSRVERDWGLKLVSNFHWKIQKARRTTVGSGARGFLRGTKTTDGTGVPGRLRRKREAEGKFFRVATNCAGSLRRAGGAVAFSGSRQSDELVKRTGRKTMAARPTTNTAADPLKRGHLNFRLLRSPRLAP